VFESDVNNFEEEGISYVRNKSPGDLLTAFEARIRRVEDAEYLNKLAVKLSKIMTMLLERRIENYGK